jgi:glycosyl transferase family 25
MNPFNKFKHIYYINLAHRTDRALATMLEFSKIGVEKRIKRFDAIQGSGNLGCKLSHLELFKLAHINKWPNIVVFEDDVQFVNDPLPTLKLALDQVSDDFDLMYLGATVNSPMIPHTANTYRNSGAYAYCYSHRAI